MFRESPTTTACGSVHLALRIASWVFLVTLSAAPAVADYAAPFRTYPMGFGLSAVSLTDWNGDGALDLTVASFDSAKVSTRPGNGTGGFGPRIDFLLGDKPTRMAAADLTGDGVLDMLTLVGSTNRLLVLRGIRGKFGFDQITAIAAVGTSPIDLAVGDLNHDGRQDVVVVSVSENYFRVFLGKGKGQLNPPVLHAISSGGQAVALGDLNADGHLDIAIALSNSVWIGMGDGAGGFTPQSPLSTGPTPRDLAIARLNGDAVADIVALRFNSTTGEIIRWLGTGGGSFGTPSTTQASGPGNRFVVGQFAGDVLPDLAVMNTDGTGAVYPGSPSGFTVAPIPFISGSMTTDIAAGDIDRDGDLDLAISASPRTGSVLIGNGDGTFGSNRAIPLGPPTPELSQVALADMNGNGTMDFVATYRDTIMVVQGDGSGGATGLTRTFVPALAERGLTLADFDGDGDTDVAVAVATGGGGSIYVFPNTMGSLGAHQDYPVIPDPRNITAGDLNHDGRVDLVIAHDGSMRVFLNTGTAFAFSGTVPSGRVDDVAIGDVNGDTHPDLCVADESNTHVLVYMGNGAGGFGIANSIPSFYDGLTSVELTDYDQDGDLDIVGITGFVDGDEENFAQLFTNLGAGSFGPPQDVSFLGAPKNLIAYSSTSGGIARSVLYVTLANNVMVLTSTAGGPYQITTPGWGAGCWPSGIARGFVDGDTISDLVVADPGGSSLASGAFLRVLLGTDSPATPPDRAPTVLAPATVNVEANGTVSFGVSATDIDGDPVTTLSATSIPTGAVFTPSNGNTGTFSWSPTLAQVGDYVVTFAATNALTASTSTIVHVLPMDAEAAGVFLWTPQSGEQGSYNACFNASGHSGEPSSTLCTTLTVSPPSPGLAAPAPFPVALAPGSSTSAPFITIKGSTTVMAGQTLALSPYASTADTLSVSTSALPATNNATFESDQSPVVSVVNQIDASPGAQLVINVNQADPDGDFLPLMTADLTGLPPGNNASFDPVIRRLTWTPTSNDSGKTFGVVFRAANALVGYASTMIHVRSGLVAYWRLNGNAADVTGHTSDLIANGVANYGAGHINQALVLDAFAADGLYRAATTDYNLPTSPWSVECWFRVTTPSFGEPSPIIRVGQPGPGAAEYWSVQVPPDGALHFFAQGSGIVTDLNSLTTVVDGMWHHVAVTSNGSSVTIYMDGNMKSSLPWQRSVNVAGGSVTLGFDLGGSGQLGGGVDEVRIWRLERTQAQISAWMNMELDGYATAVETAEGAPQPRNALRQNHPNPFNPRTEISFEAAHAGRASLRIYDVSGRLVRTLLDTDALAAGGHRVTWDGVDRVGRKVASGIYLYRFEMPGYAETRRMTLLK